MTDWDRLRDGLARELAILPSGALVVVIESGGAGRYAQFAQTDTTLRTELISDNFLEQTHRPSPHARQLLIDNGWREPVGNSGNWWIELPWPITTAIYRYLAQMVVTGLRDGLGLPDPSVLVYDAWDSNRGNRRLDMPLLGLQHEKVGQ